MKSIVGCHISRKISPRVVNDEGVRQNPLRKYLEPLVAGERTSGCDHSHESTRSPRGHSNSQGCVALNGEGCARTVDQYGACGIQPDSQNFDPSPNLSSKGQNPDKWRQADVFAEYGTIIGVSSKFRDTV